MNGGFSAHGLISGHRRLGDGHRARRFRRKPDGVFAISDQKVIRSFSGRQEA
jgi:hypothetical protein